VGKYLAEHFVSSFQKVGTFRLAGEQKQGGNVASYFTTPKGKVLHVIAGPVDATRFLSEARWVVELCKLAELEKQTTPAKLKMVFRKAHMDRLHLSKNALPFGISGPKPSFAAFEYCRKYLGDQINTTQGKTHWLLAMYPLAQIEDIYRPVFQSIVNERLSTEPVNGKRTEQVKNGKTAKWKSSPLEVGP
jgi:hypothetical protein